MAKNDNLNDFLADVANAIRLKKGTSDLINPQDFRKEIESIESGGSTIEYRDMSGIEALTRANLVAEIAFMAKFSMDGTTLTCFATQAKGIIDTVGSDGVISISTDLNAKVVTHSSDGSFSFTVKEVLIQRGWWEDYNSCPIITEEQFYSPE